MNQQQFITKLVGTSTLDLTVVIKDTAESKVTAKFIALTFETNSQVALKLEVTTINKDVTINEQGQSTEMDPITFFKIIRADERTQVPVIDENDNPLLDGEGVQLTVPENVFWKHLAWEQALYAPFKVLLENVIKVKFNLIPNNIVLKVDRALINYPIV